MNEPAKPAPETPVTDGTPTRRTSASWLKRLGVVGFLLFLIKGLLWIIVPVLVAKGCLSN